MVIVVPKCSECLCMSDCNAYPHTRDNPNPECLDLLESRETDQNCV